MALSGDPENAELLQLKADLATLIQLTAETIQEDQAKAGNGQDPVLSFLQEALKADPDPQEYLTVLTYGTVLVTWRDESSPPCRKVVDTSGRRCGRPSSFARTVVYMAFHRCVKML